MEDENITAAADPEPMQATEPESEPMQANPYESIIEQQQAQIAALMEQTKTLNAQIVNLVSSGAQLNQTQQAPQQAPQQQMQSFNPNSLADDKDWSLEGLAEQIGKKNV